MSDYLLRCWIPAAAVTLACFLLVTTAGFVFPPKYIERVNQVLAAIPQQHQHEQGVTHANTATLTFGSERQGLEDKFVLTTSEQRFDERWYHAAPSFEVIMRQLGGKYVWAIAGICQIIAHVLSSCVAATYVARSYSVITHRINTLWASVIFYLFLAAVLLLWCGYLNWIPILGYNVGPVHEFLYRTAFHADSFEEVTHSGRTYFDSFVDLGTNCAVLLAVSNVSAVTCILLHLAPASSFSQMGPAQIVKESRATSKAQKDVNILLLIVALCLTIGLFQIIALARWGLALVSCQVCQSLFKGQEDAAIFAVGGSLTFLMIALFGTAQFILTRRNALLLEALTARGVGKKWRSKLSLDPTMTDKFVQAFQLSLPLLTSLVGISLK